MKRSACFTAPEAMSAFVSTSGAIGKPAASAPVQPSPRLKFGGAFAVNVPPVAMPPVMFDW